MSVREEVPRRWVLVRVWRGIPSELEVFADAPTARRREVHLRKKLPMEDELALFEIDCKRDVGKRLHPSVA